EGAAAPARAAPALLADLQRQGRPQRRRVEPTGGRHVGRGVQGPQRAGQRLQPGPARWTNQKMTINQATVGRQQLPPRVQGQAAPDPRAAARAKSHGGSPLDPGPGGAPSAGGTSPGPGPGATSPWPRAGPRSPPPRPTRSLPGRAGPGSSGTPAGAGPARTGPPGP